MNAQQEDAFRLEKATQFLADCQEAENQARRTLADKAATTKRAQEKYETLFLEIEAREFVRRKAAC